MTSNAKSIIDQFKALPADQQSDVARTIDQLTWSKRWAEICKAITERKPAFTDDQVDELVKGVRREKPLSERSSTHQS